MQDEGGRGGQSGGDIRGGGEGGDGGAGGDRGGGAYGGGTGGSGRPGSGRKQLSTRREGYDQVNTISISFQNIRLTERYPRDDNIFNFLSSSLKLDIHKVNSVTHLKSRQRILVSFTSSEYADECLHLIQRGIIFPGTNSKVEAFRTDEPSVSVSLIGAPLWVPESDIRVLFERYGTITSIERGT